MYVYQDVEKWAGEGLIDELYPMIYAATAEEHIERADEIAAGIGESCRLVLGLGTYDGQTPEIVAEQAVYNRTAGGNGNSIFALPYTQVFGFDRLYAEGLYRKPAVHTDDCGAAMPAFLAELCETIDSTYLYLCPDCGAERVKDKIAAAADELAGLGGAADDESRLAYWQQAAQTMHSLREALDDAGVETRVQADLLDRMDYIEQIIARNIAAVQRRLR